MSAPARAEGRRGLHAVSPAVVFERRVSAYQVDVQGSFATDEDF
jgi:hypothetical protein